MVYKGKGKSKTLTAKVDKLIRIENHRRPEPKFADGLFSDQFTSNSAAGGTQIDVIAQGDTASTRNGDMATFFGLQGYLQLTGGFYGSTSTSAINPIPRCRVLIALCKDNRQAVGAPAFTEVWSPQSGDGTVGFKNWDNRKSWTVLYNKVINLPCSNMKPTSTNSGAVTAPFSSMGGEHPTRNLKVHLKLRHRVQYPAASTAGNYELGKNHMFIWFITDTQLASGASAPPSYVFTYRMLFNDPQ